MMACGHHGHGDHEGHMSHRFDDAEKWAEHFDAPERAAWQKPEHVISLMEIDEGMTVADIGAGTGYFLPHLSGAVGPSGKVLGLDIEQTLVEHMAARARDEELANVEARVVAPDDPGLEQAAVDRILLVNTWHHIGDRVSYGEKLRASLREGGALFVVDIELESEHGPPREHKMPPEEIIAELEEAGFQAIQIDEELSEQYIVVGRP